jgi:mono/diheme cytochrome c family protein
MKRFLKWAAAALLVLVVVGFGCFLYLIPPFFLTPPEDFGKAMAGAAPVVTDIADPAERAIAARGRYIVMTVGCIGCHAQNGAQGPDLTKYLAGGALKIQTAHGTYVSRNLTSDKETGLGRRTDDEVKRVLRSGTFPDGHVVAGTAMPWPVFSNWTEEDRHAVVVYLRHLKPIRHATPEPTPGNAITIPGAIEQDYAGKDYGIPK